MRSGFLRQSHSFLVITLGALTTVAGCSGQQTAAPTGPSSDLVPGNDARGITIRWLALDAQVGQVALLQALEPHVSKTSLPLSPVDRRRWAENGLAVASVPASAVRAIEKSLPLTAVQARNSADMLTWSDLATGPAWPEERPIASPDGTTRLDSGRIRLLGRSWATPVLTDSGPQTVTRLELVLQHVPDRPSLASQLEPPGAPKGALAKGPTFARTSIGLDLPPDQCLVVFAESPGTDRQAILRPEMIDRPETTSSDAAPAPQPILTLGELLLTGFATEGQVRTRVVLLIMGRPAASAAKLDQ